MNWQCHWCSWQSYYRRRFFDRRRAVQEIKDHLKSQHPGIVYHPWTD